MKCLRGLTFLCVLFVQQVVSAQDIPIVEIEPVENEDIMEDTDFDHERVDPEYIETGTEIRFITREEPYVLSESLYIPPEKKLVIEPGVTIEFEGGSLDIFGSITAIGTEIDPIVIRGIGESWTPNISIIDATNASTLSYVKVENLSNNWFLLNSEIYIDHSEFKGGKSGISGANSKLVITDSSFLDLDSDAVTFYFDSVVEAQNITVQSVSQGFILYNHTTATLEDISISNVKATFGAGIAGFNNSKITVKNSFIEASDDCIQIFTNTVFVGESLTLKRCFQAGLAGYDLEGESSLFTLTKSEITESGYGIILLYPDVKKIYRNKIHGNTEGAFVIGQNIVDLSWNWWGATSGPIHADNPEGLGDLVWGTTPGNTIISPWFKSEGMKVRDPVIIIPGITGTELFKDYGNKGEIWPAELKLVTSPFDTYLNDLALLPTGEEDPEKPMVAGEIIKETPGGDIFAGLLNELESNSYKEDIDLFIFPYDWRLTNSVNDQKLKEKIDSVLVATGAEKVDIVAHSMGGILSKSYIKEFGDEKIDQLFFVGTPHLGAPKAYKALMYGDNLNAEVFGISLLSEKRIKEITQNMPSLFELLPSKQYVDTLGHRYLEDLGEFVLSEERINLNPLLTYDEIKSYMISQGRNNAMFEFSESLHVSIDKINYGNVRIYNFTGCGVTKTLNGISLSKKKTLGLIPSSEPKISLEYGMGDKTVPWASSYISNLNTQYFIIEGDHSALPSVKEVREGIIALLSDGEPVLTGALTQDIGKCGVEGRVIEIHSPVALHIYDEEGNHTGPLDNGNIEYGIPEVSYDVIGEEKFAFVPDGKKYRIVNTAEDIGFYDLYVSKSDKGDHIPGRIYFSSVPIESLNMEAELVIDESNLASSTLSIDQDGNGEFDNVITPALTLDKPSEEGSEEDVVLKISKSRSSLMKIEELASEIKGIATSVPVEAQPDDPMLTSNNEPILGYEDIRQSINKASQKEVIQERVISKKITQGDAKELLSIPENSRNNPPVYKLLILIGAGILGGTIFVRKFLLWRSL